MGAQELELAYKFILITVILSKPQTSYLK